MLLWALPYRMRALDLSIMPHLPLECSRDGVGRESEGLLGVGGP